MNELALDKIRTAVAVMVPYAKYEAAYAAIRSALPDLTPDQVHRAAKVAVDAAEPYIKAAVKRVQEEG